MLASNLEILLMCVPSVTLIDSDSGINRPYYQFLKDLAFMHRTSRNVTTFVSLPNIRLGLMSYLTFCDSVSYDFNLLSMTIINLINGI